MFWHLLLSKQREQLGRQLLCCPGRQLIAVFAKARDRRQCRGKSRRQHKRTDYRGADRALAMALRQSSDRTLTGCSLDSVTVTGRAVSYGRAALAPASRARCSYIGSLYIPTR